MEFRCDFSLFQANRAIKFGGMEQEKKEQRIQPREIDSERKKKFFYMFISVLHMNQSSISRAKKIIQTHWLNDVC